MCARLLVVALACLTVGCGSRIVPSAGPGSKSTHHAQSATRRPVYPYSVIEGGVQDSYELRGATMSDAIVREHYRDVDAHTLTPQRLQREQFAYVSFRRSGRVYWTSHKVRLAEGEMVLANSSGPRVRARCGNRIAYEPQQPTLPKADEPAEAELLTPIPASGIPYDVAMESPLWPKSGPGAKAPSGPGDVQLPPVEKKGEASRDSQPVTPGWLIDGGPATWMTSVAPISISPTKPPVQPPPGVVVPEPAIPSGRLPDIEAWIILPSNIANPPQPYTTLPRPPGITVLPPASGGGGVVPPPEYHDGGSTPGGGDTPNPPTPPTPPPPPPDVQETPEPSTGILVMGGLFMAVIYGKRALQ